MPAPTFSSSTPTSGATNVAKNASISVVFSTALLGTSVDNRTVYLRHEGTRQIVACSVALSSDGLTITIVPAALLLANTAYKVVVVGANVSTTCIKSTDSSSLATTVQISFQTGDGLSVDSSTGIKTTAETLLEGGAVLPDDIGFRSTVTPLRLLRVNPKQHGFGMSTSATRIRFEFTSPIDISTATGNITVLPEAFYGEEDFLAIETDIGDGVRHYFNYETANYTGEQYLDPAYFEDPTFTYSVTGNYLDINISPNTGDLLPNNLSFTVELAGSLASTTGAELGEDLVYFTCVEPYPKWDSLSGVRHEVGSAASLEAPDDFVGLRIWRSTIDLWTKLWQEANLVSPSRYYREYVRIRAALDVWDDLMVSKYLNSGTVKELGDLRIQYNTGSGGARSRKVGELEDRLKRLYQVIWGYYTRQPAIGIKSEWDHYEPGRDYFRDRLWRAELAQNKGQGGLAGKLAANTAYTRAQTEVSSRSLVWDESRGWSFL